MYYYRAYGLTIASEFPIDQFIPMEPVPSVQVTIKRGQVPLPRKSLRFKLQKILSQDNGYLLYWKKIGAFLVEGGTRVTVMPFPASEGTRFINALIVGAVMGTVLLQRGEHRLFHAAVLGKEDGREAVAFMAESGGGKSTMATGMLRRGYSLVCDDMLVLERDKVPLTVQPGFPGMKLWRESARNLVEDADSLPMLGSKGKYEKRFLTLEEKFLDHPIALGCIFLLNYGKVEKPAVKALTPREALPLILPHWYGSLFRGDLLPILGRERLFRECSFLAREGKIFSLSRPFDMDRLDETVGLIDEIRKNGGLLK